MSNIQHVHPKSHHQHSEISGLTSTAYYINISSTRYVPLKDSTEENFYRPHSTVHRKLFFLFFGNFF